MGKSKKDGVKDIYVLGDGNLVVLDWQGNQVAGMQINLMQLFFQMCHKHDIEVHNAVLHMFGDRYKVSKYKQPDETTWRYKITHMQ